MKKWWGILLSLVLFMSACGASEQSNPKKTAKSSDDVVSFVGVGDNLIHEGCGGQAIIRHCENSFGIPTKRLPNMSEEAFFSDQPDEIQQTLAHLIALVTVFETGYFDTFVFPLDGVGTGRAKLKEKSPIIYNMISEFFSNRFNLNIMPL